MPAYKRILLKLSGEALMGDDAYGINRATIVRMVDEIAEVTRLGVELAVVIGKGGKNISQSDAMSHVFGYTVVNDVTARDVQMRHQQWDMGKSFDTFCPMGPWIVTADEIDGRKTRVRCWVNGELRQDGNSRDMLNPILPLIQHICGHFSLQAGDVILTGTPEGVVNVNVGDEVVTEVEGIGRLMNTIVGDEIFGLVRDRFEIARE